MLSVPPAMETLLKSKIMIGENRPAGTVTIAGQPAGSEIEEWTEPKYIRATKVGEEWYSGEWVGGSFVTRTDDKILVTYADTSTKEIYLSVVDSEDDLFYDDNACVANEWVHETLDYMQYTKTSYAPSRLFKLPNGEILLFVTDSGWWNDGSPIPAKFKVYKSTNGLGTDFSLLTTVAGSISGITKYSSGQWKTAQIGMPLILTGGRLLVPWQSIEGSYYGYPCQAEKVLYSDDNGLTWTSVIIRASFTGAAYHWGAIGVFGSRLVIFHQTDYSAGNQYFYYSDDEGATWTATAKVGDGSEYWGSIYGHGGGYTYFLYCEDSVSGWDVYRCLDTETWDPDNPYPSLDDYWEKISTTRKGDDELEFIWLTEGNRIAIAGTSIYGGTVAYIWGATLGLETPLPIKRIEIDRSKGSASKATIVIDNKNGQYAPDNVASEYYQVIWLNKETDITLGYGDVQQQVFTGLIDNIDMDASVPATLTINTRDKAKLALDQLVRMWWVDHWAYTVIYQWQTLEYIFNDLALKAGFATGTIHTEATGITLAELKVVHQSYADAFQRLCELSAFEWFTDEIGDIYFRPAVEPAPTADWQYAEGVDIFQLNYNFSDRELYRGVVVIAKDTDGNLLRYDLEWSAADYNNVLHGKWQIINATDIAVTMQQVISIAQKACDALNAKPRQVSFMVVGNPYLQIGDCLQVTETTTTISELYRIYALRHVWDAEGDPVAVTYIDCYHYANLGEFSSSYQAVEGTDTDAVTPVQDWADTIAPGSTITIVDSDNTQVNPDTGEITYGAAPVTGDVTFSDGANNIVVSITVPASAKNVMNYGAEADGVTDDTDAFNDAIAAAALAGVHVYAPAGTYVIDPDTSIQMESNVILYMATGATLKAKAVASGYNAVIAMDNISDSGVIGGKIVGDRNIHLGTSGEHGMGIRINGCDDIVIDGVSIKDCWGDGIYLGNGSQGYNDNVLIQNFNIQNCRRNGIGVISNKNLTVQDGVISNINGLAPQDGIDVEPNVNTDWMYNLLFKNIQTYNCRGFGCFMTFWFYGGSSNEVLVTFDNCIDSGSVRNTDFGVGADPYVELYIESEDCHVYIT